MIVLFIFIGVVLLGTWILSPKIDWNTTDEDNKEQNKKQMTETDIILGITDFCKENGFIEKDEELKIYDPTEKDKDDLFDEVFDIEGINTKYLTRCIKNCVTGEEITVVITKYNYIYPINKLDEDGFLMSYNLDEVDESSFEFYFCYSKREIEKVELEKQIKKLNIPNYISCNFNMYKNTLHFYIQYKEVEDLTISRNELTKEKILQNIEECKKRYAQKHEKLNTIRNQIQNIFN